MDLDTVELVVADLLGGPSREQWEGLARDVGLRGFYTFEGRAPLRFSAVYDGRRLGSSDVTSSASGRRRTTLRAALGVPCGGSCRSRWG